MARTFEKDGSRYSKPGLVKCAQLPHAIGVQDVLFSGLKLGNDFSKIQKRAVISTTDYVHAPSPFIKLDWGGHVPKTLFHQGRTDGNGGHHDWLNREGHGIGAYHYHHKMPAHLHPDGRCPYGSLEASIINPYTGKSINHGRAYYYEDEPYYSLNLVAKALTAWDTMGASLSLLPVLPPYFNCGGNFNACNKGESTYPNGTLGERFSFTYPALPVIGTLQDNTFFDADGDNGGKLRLLCHTKKAEDDAAVCYAYVALEEIRNYMTSNDYFTDFSNSGSGVWCFNVIKPAVHITAPVNGSAFKIGDEIVVQASIENAVRSRLFIGETLISSRNHLRSKSAITFDSFLLEEKSAGNIPIMVESHPGGTATIAETVTSTLRVNVEKEEEPPTSKHFITIEMMQNFGWQASSLTDEYINTLNETLEFYGITDMNSIRLFMATCGHESGKGRLSLEGLPLLSWAQYQEHERGAGYIQITYRDAHLAFLNSISDTFTGQNTAEYIASKYPWEAAAWHWTTSSRANLRPSLRLWPGITLSEFVEDRGDSFSIFLLTQYAVNGWGVIDGVSPPPDSVAEKIMNGVSWRIENDGLHVDGEAQIFRLPVGWADREKNYQEAINLFK